MKTVQYITLISSTSHVVKENNSSSLTKTGISERNSTLKKEITNIIPTAIAKTKDSLMYPYK